MFSRDDQKARRSVEATPLQKTDAVQIFRLCISGERAVTGAVACPVEEVIDVFVVYDAGWNGVILDRKACPAYGSARQRGMRMQE